MEAAADALVVDSSNRPVRTTSRRLVALPEFRSEHNRLLNGREEVLSIAMVDIDTCERCLSNKVGRLVIVINTALVL
jgi:hypothetical protein